MKQWIVKCSRGQFPMFFAKDGELYDWTYEPKNAMFFVSRESADSFIITTRLTASVEEINVQV